MGVLNRAAIKQEARGLLSVDNKWFKMFFAVLLYYILSDFSYVTNLFGIDDGSARFTVSFGVELLSLVALPFGAAVAGYFLNWLRGFNPDAKSLYKEGIDNFGSYFAGRFITKVTIFLWSLLFVIPGIIKAFEYSQVDYILHDNSKLKASQAKRMSSIMTNGYKSELFILELSFIGWEIAGVCTLGIVYIYALPYMETVRAMYYENLKSNAIENGLIAPEAFMPEPPIYNDFQSEQNPQSPYDIAQSYSQQVNGQSRYFGESEAPVIPEENAEAEQISETPQAQEPEKAEENDTQDNGGNGENNL